MEEEEPEEAFWTVQPTKAVGPQAREGSTMALITDKMNNPKLIYYDITGIKTANEWKWITASEYDGPKARMYSSMVTY